MGQSCPRGEWGCLSSGTHRSDTRHQRRRPIQTLQDVRTWRGRALVDNDGNKVGKIDEIYLDRQTGDPEWVTVKTGLLGTKSSFVPIGDARPTGDDEIHVPYTKDQVKDAPNIDPDGELSEDEERQLYQHYGRADYGDWTGEDRTRDLGLPEEDRERRFDREDDAMTRSEEEMHVGTERQPAGRARLRKYVVTEDVEKTVPVERETARVEREPITDDNVEAETEERTVGGEVRKERIDPEGDA